MSHGDKLAKLPDGFHTIATTKNSEYAAIGHSEKPIYAIQFHPEVTHTEGYVTQQLLASTRTDQPQW